MTTICRTLQCPFWIAATGPTPGPRRSSIIIFLSIAKVSLDASYLPSIVFQAPIPWICCAFFPSKVLEWRNLAPWPLWPQLFHDPFGPSTANIIPVLQDTYNALGGFIWRINNIGVFTHFVQLVRVGLVQYEPPHVDFDNSEKGNNFHNSSRSI